jgi:hypothetical protein
MASYTIINNAKPYYQIRVSFNGMDFDQTIVSAKTGAALLAQMQCYADEYEATYAGPTPDVIDVTDKTVFNG